MDSFPNDDKTKKDLREFHFKSQSVSLEMIRQRIPPPNDSNPRNLMLELVNDVSKISQHFRGITDYQSPVGLDTWTEIKIHSLSETLNETLISLIRLADSCQIDLSLATIEKMIQNERKYPIQKSYGVSKKYDQL